MHIDKGREIRVLQVVMTAVFYWHMYVAGTDPDTLFSESYPHFHGCMSDIRFQNKEGKIVPIAATMMEGVLPECTDYCTDNPCHHGGQCINNYNEAICDCFGTDYQGEFCSELGKTQLTEMFYMVKR